MRDQRAYRVQGIRENGKVYSKDFFNLQAAESCASSLIKPRLEPGERGPVLIPALTNVRIIRSAPIRWIYPEQENT